MKIENWERVEGLFLAAADMSAAERVQFLDTSCDGDAALRAEVESLLAADCQNGAAIVAAVHDEARSLLGDEGVIGSRLGPYRVLREIGRGGMGAVYLATRDDDEYQKEVAIKLIRRGMDTDDVLDRFRHERQILANLDHPYIARLLDGGTDRDGRPFFVMEYVTGQPLDVWCHERQCNIEDRCRLFLKVCEAVSHAHRNLVIHRDLKPGNIFVTAEGSPKLIDFGVAKLLDPNTAFNGTETVISMRPITPAYASPEQVRAEQITTAADIYSLGAVLYELLSGVRAHRFRGYDKTEVERVICELDPSLMSEVALSDAAASKQLRGDLDAIVSMAMRKEPERRYQSVEQMADDIQRYLNRWPVKANQGTFVYLAGKYMRRNRTAIAVGAILAFALVGGSAGATWQAVRAARAQAMAERERQLAISSQVRAQASQRNSELQAAEAQTQRANAETQRREAEAQRQLADRRFEQVHQLAGTFLLDFHNAIASLPGSTPARKMVVQTGLQYYDTLVRDAGNNRDLLEEIARGYDRLGDVQGNPYYANLGDIAGAISSYRRAISIRENISDPAPPFWRDRIQGQVKLAQVEVAKGDYKDADRLYKEAFALGRQSPAAGTYDVRDALANAYSAFGDLKIKMGVHGDAIEPYLMLLQLQTELAHEKKNEAAEQRGIGMAHTKLGDVYMRVDRPRDAVDHLRLALAMDKRAAAAEPNNLPVMRKLFVTYSLLGRVLHSRTGKDLAGPGEVTTYLEGALDLATKMAALDHQNRQPALDIVMAGSGLGDWLREQKLPLPAIEAYRTAINAAEGLQAMSPQDAGNEDALIQVHQRMAVGLNEAARYDEALEHLRSAEEALARAEKRIPDSTRNISRRADIASSRAEIFMAQQRWTDAIEAWSTTARLTEALRKRDPGNQVFINAEPELHARLAESYAAAGRRESAIQEIQTALERLREIEAKRPLASAEIEARQNDAAKLAQWQRP